MGGGAMEGEEDRMYGNGKSFWDARYKKDGGMDEFEWYQSYENIKDKINAAFPDKNGKVINLGCGTSSLPIKMAKDGYQSIMNVDISDECIAGMKSKAAQLEAQLQWKEMDIRGDGMAEIADGTFDCAIDKGTLDSLLCGSNSTQNVYKYLCSVKRILKPGGTLLVLSHGTPQKRDSHLKRGALKFTVSVAQVDKPTAAGVEVPSGMEKQHFLYTCKMP